MRHLILLFGIFLAQTAAHALSLEQAQSEAAANNPDVQRLKAAADRQSWGKLSALSTYIPHLSASYDNYFKAAYMRQNIEFGNSVVNFPAGYPKEMLNLDAEWTVFDGFSAYDRFRAARLNAEAADLDLNRAEMALSTEVRNSFYQALAARKLLEVAKQNVKTLEEHLNRAHLSERSGYGVRFDALRIEATLEEARADQEAAENNVAIARDGLTALLGRPARDDRPLEGDLPVLKETDVPKDIALDPSARADVQAQFKRDEAAAREASAGRGEFYPTLSLFANQQYYKFGNFDPAILPSDKYESAWAVGMRLKWNLFDGGKTYAHSRMANDAAVEARARTAKEISALPRDFDTWKRKYFQSVSLYRARTRALKQFEESVRLAGVGLKAGTRTHTEMLDAELDLFRARGGVVRAQTDAIEALGKLELAVGHSLR